MNPLGLIEALLGAMNHSADLAVQHAEKSLSGAEKEEVLANARELYSYTDVLRKALHNTFRYGQGTRDMAGPEGFSTEKFVDKVAWRLGRYMAALYDENYTLDKL
eukprot:7169222-Prorocentrum_lima.AAC.1